jgi:TOMM system kinase/cyclase fusion protein
MEVSLQAHGDIAVIFKSEFYQLHEKIGEGGFGQVYKALQVSTNNFVAIKFLSVKAELDSDKKRRYIERFHREADLVRRLNHPNIVHLIDKGQQGDELLYAVYEYIDGQSLKEYLNQMGPIDAPQAAEVMATVLDALAHAHDKGVIHRDVKPANIMLYNVGAKLHVKVLDFGIGTLMNEARQLDYKSITLTQETLGTPSYSAPEQLRGEPPVVQTDIYVWGLVFLECLTGKPTISGSSLAAVFHQQLSPVNVPLGVLAGHESAHLLRRVLNKKAQERPVNTAELYHAFRKLNFSNLVGDLSLLPEFSQVSHAVDSDVTMNSDETMVSEGRFSFTRLTERKQISVLCLILATEPVNGDIGENQDVIDTFHADQMQQCIDIAIRYGANHVGSLGDTMLFYFGYPLVTDNDSRLCSRTALDIAGNLHKKSSLLKQSHGIISNFQMGIQTGLMLSLASNLPEGKAAHDAMTLCRQAKQGQILCSENVKQLLEGYLSFEACNNQAARSLDAQALFLLRGERQAEAFGFLRSTRKNQAFIGREKEIEALIQQVAAQHCDVANDAKQSGDKSASNRLVHIHGEAGIGKSRLVFELRERTQSQCHFVAQCLPEHQNNALHPILNLLKFKYSLDTLSDEDCLARLKLAMAKTSLSEAYQEHGLLVLSTWLYLPLPEHNPAENLSPEEQKQRLFDVIGHLLCQLHQGESDVAMATRHLFVFEDLHWSDPTSMEFVQYIVQSETFIQGQHSWVNTSREVLPDALSSHNFNIIEITKLNDASTRVFIDCLFENQPLAQGLVDILLERTDGIPLFIEELAATLKSQNLVHKVNGEVDFVDVDKQAQVPNSLRDSLQQKLDRLRHSKDSAQLAATIGRQFDYALLVAVSAKGEAQVQIDLEELIANELVYLQRHVEGDSYIFKHALVRDAAYDSMTKALELASHAQIANCLEGRSTQQDNSSLLARHFGAANLFEKAVEYGTAAANAAAKISAAVETIAEAQKVEKWIEQFDFDAQVNPKLAIYSLLTSAYMESKGWASAEVFQYSERSTQLLRQSQRFDELIPNLWWKVLNGVVGAKNEGLLDMCEELETFVDNDNVSDISKAAIKCAHAFVVFAQGGENAYPICHSLLLAGLDYYQRSNGADDQHETTFGFNVGVFSKASLARVLVLLDRVDEAAVLVKEALQDSENIDHIPSIGIASMYCAEVFLLINDADANRKKATVYRYAAKLVELSQRHDMPVYKCYGQMEVDWSKSQVDNEQSSFEFLHQSGSLFGVAHYQSYYADTYASQNQMDKAIEKIDFCLDLDEQAGHHHYKAKMLMNKARYMAASKQYTNAEITTLLAQASELAHAQGATYYHKEVTTVRLSLSNNH